jgi:diacylglycerol O-acyltransferase
MAASDGRRVGRRQPIRRLTTYDQHCLRVETADRPLQLGVLALLEAGGLLDADGRPRVDALRTAVDRRLPEVPALRRIVRATGHLAGGPVWVDDPAFRIDHHVVAAETRPPGDEPALLELAERLIAPGLDRTRPLWRMWIIGGLEGGRVAVLVVVHHALADGRTAMRMIRTLLETDNVPTDAAPPAGAFVAPPPSWPALVADHARSVGASAASLARAATWRQLLGVIRYGRRVIALGRRAPASSLNAPVGPRRRLCVIHLEGSDARRIARDGGASVNDLVLALVSGGVDALLRARGERTERLRPRAGVALALFSAGRGDAPGNDIGTMLVALPLAERDPHARLARISAETDRAAHDPMIALEPTFRAWVRRFGGGRAMEHQRLVNLHETFLPGPPRAIRVLGAEVLWLVPLAPLAGNLGLSVVALSYAGRLSLAVRADADTFPDLDVMTDAMATDWRLLRDGAGPGSAAEPPPAALLQTVSRL